MDQGVSYTPLPGIKGWLRPQGAQLWHAFDSNARSMCRRHDATDMPDDAFEAVYVEAAPTTNQDCRTCSRKVEAAWLAADEEVTP